MLSTTADSSLRGPGAATLFVAEGARRPKWPLSNRDHFWRAVDTVTANDVVATRLTRRIERKQRQLQSIVGELGWRTYVDIEELQARRTLRWIELVANWAQAHGARRRRPR